MVNAIGREGPGERTKIKRLPRYRYASCYAVAYCRCNPPCPAPASFPRRLPCICCPLRWPVAAIPACQEAVVAGDPAVITWLQLRFGGTVSTALLEPELAPFPG